MTQLGERLIDAAREANAIATSSYTRVNGEDGSQSVMVEIAPHMSVNADLLHLVRKR